ncbi:MAG: M28 family peptidase [Deltaproteobacteria bacterium]|nr:M28 family peptidase [Deltaproteobacteria bacterium]
MTSSAIESEDGCDRAAERQRIASIIGRIIQACPERRSTSAQERRAQEMMAPELSGAGLQCSWHPFTFNDNLHANMALHFGLGVLGTAISGLFPAAGLALHAGAAASYWADGARRGYFLRRLLKFKEAANLVAVAPARGPVRLRLVFIAHADAGFTGWVFDPRVIRGAEGGPGILKRPLALATAATGALAGFDALRMVLGPLALPLRPLEWLFTVPAAITCVLNAQIILKDTVVPGANDDLSGVEALPVLARRLLMKVPDGVELSFVVSACEEAFLGGADALAREMEGTWEKDRTVVIALDALTNGDLHFIGVEGEVSSFASPRWLRETAAEVAARMDLPGGLKTIDPPAGGSDAGPFLARGYDALALVCVDPALGAPRHYHQPGDTLENLDMDQLMRSIDFCEALAREIIWRRLGR